LREHPIAGLMRTAMDSIRQMVDVNTVVGRPVEAPDGSVVIPISRVSLGFAAGGGDHGQRQEEGGRPVGRNGRQGGGEVGGGTGRGGQTGQVEADEIARAFAGGSGAGVSVQPVGFLVVGQGTVRLLTVDGSAVLDRIIDVAPEVLDIVRSIVRGDDYDPDAVEDQLEV